ncbi:hypothetical protein [Brevundimonas sp.]|uniref:hypothetical protein n=1 Tax=Brevundimonas sp. TaxID=1871086 RepID=UPI002FCB8150
MSRVLILVAALALAACQTVPEADPAPPVLDACPPSATATVEPAPREVPVSNDERLGLDVAGIRILGADRFADLSLSEAQQDARTVRLEGRVEQTRRWCEGRQPRPG